MEEDELIARFRLVTGIEVSDINDTDLADLLTENDGDVNLAAAAFFDRQATKFSRLVDVSESGSSRSLSQLYKNAVAMSDSYRKRIATSDPKAPSSHSRTRLITRAEA